MPDSHLVVVSRLWGTPILTCTRSSNIGNFYVVLAPSHSSALGCVSSLASHSSQSDSRHLHRAIPVSIAEYRSHFAMPPFHIGKSIYFGSFLVNHQVFHLTSHTFALVNLKPLLPGHVLVSPLRVVPHLSDLSPLEVTDLFMTVQRIGRMVQRVYKASALNIAIQDGEAAGQSVPHLHAHIIPRKQADLDNRGGTDAIYDMMESADGDVSKQMRDASKFPAPDPNEERTARSREEMEKEAAWLASELEQEPK